MAGHENSAKKNRSYVACGKLRPVALNYINTAHTELRHNLRWDMRDRIAHLMHDTKTDYQAQRNDGIAVYDDGRIERPRQTEAFN